MNRLELHSVNVGSGAVTETLPVSSAILHLFITAIPELSYKRSNLERRQEQLCASLGFPHTRSSMWLCSQSSRPGEVSSHVVYFPQSGNKIKLVN